MYTILNGHNNGNLSEFNRDVLKLMINFLELEDFIENICRNKKKCIENIGKFKKENI